MQTNNAAVVDFSYSHYLISDEADATRLLSIMMNAQAVEVNYNNVLSFVSESTKAVCTFKVLPASAVPVTSVESEAVQRMQKEVEAKNMQWYKEYNERQALDKQLKEVQAKLDAALEQIKQTGSSQLAEELDADATEAEVFEYFNPKE